MPETPRVHHGLTDLLVDAGVVTPAQVEAGLLRQRETGLRIGETLVEIGAATEEDIGWALAQQLGMPLVDLQGDMLDAELLDSFPAALLSRLQAVPLLRSEEGLSFALSDPTDRQAIAHLELLAECPVLPSVATPTAIRRVLAPRLGTSTTAVAARSDFEPAGGFVVWDRSGASFLHYQLHAAQRAFATAIHLLPDAAGVHVYQRLATGLKFIAHESRETFEGLLTQLEILGVPVGAIGNDLHREVRVEFSHGAGTIRLGIALLQVGGATMITLRLPPAAGTPETLDQLGLEPVDLACVREVIGRDAGVVLVNGPASAGTNATLACLLAESLGEDRIAIVFGEVPLVRPANARVLVLPSAQARADWEAIVNAHGPDVIVFDDLPLETCLGTLAASAGMGRMILARSNWGDTFALLEQASENPHQRTTLASRLLLVLQQRLLPGSACDAVARPRFEVLVLSDALREAIRCKAPARELQTLAVAEGFRTLSELLAAELQAGTLDSAAVARARMA